MTKRRHIGRGALLAGWAGGTLLAALALPAAGQTAPAEQTPPAGELATAQAEAAARQAQLDWTMKFDTVTSGAAGVYDQEPAAGTPVDVGSRFVMYAHRLRN